MTVIAVEGTVLESAATQLLLLVAVLGALGALSKKAWKVTRQAVHAFETIQRELSPNGGGSTYDLVRKQIGKTDDLSSQVESLRAKVDGVEISAKKAVVAADLAVGEAKAGRAIVQDLSGQNRERIRDLRTVVGGLAEAMASESNERRLKEEAYVAALNQIGVPLMPIADELEGGHN